MTAGPKPKPAAEVDVDADLVRRLLAGQHPDLADRPIVHVATGWDNELYRIGDDLVARLPRRAPAAELVANEQRWLPFVAERVAVAVPAPLRVGGPNEEYPWAWSVCAWLPGRSMLDATPSSAADAADTLADFLVAMHVDAPEGLIDNPYRGGPLAARDDRMQEMTRRLTGVIDVDEVLGLWADLRDLPDWQERPVWLHGDLHRGNVLVHGGRVSAVIDFGDMCGGDPATDLAAAWILVEPSECRRFRTRLGHDEDTWRRARGWALSLGVAYAASGADDRSYWDLGLATIEAALADDLSW